MRGGGRGTRRWWGGVRHNKKWCSPVEEAWGRGGRGAMLGNARSGGAGLGYAGSIGQREVERVARAGRAHARGSIGRLDHWVQVINP
jgi:hypothetical protein